MFSKDKGQTIAGKIQQNLCKELLRKTKESYFESLNTKKITENRTFWQIVVPLITKKSSKGEKITLNEVEKHISDDKKIRTIFNNFFSNVLSHLKIPNCSNYFFRKAHILSQLSLKRSKNTPVFSILKKGILVQYFHSERLLRRKYRNLSEI